MASDAAPPVETGRPALWDPAVEDAEFCRRILPHVSRTFALSIAFLPSRLRYPVTVAYLVCRIADTIEDDPSRSPAEKEHLLARFAEALERGEAGHRTFAEAFQGWRGAEEGLTASASRVLREFTGLPAPERAAITPWVRIMCDGMAETAWRLDPSSGEGIRALASIEELRRYCYYVAGTVGHLLTDLFALGVPLRQDDLQTFHRLGHGFGLGLQMTNIIKDIHDDRTRGVSFVPAALCRAHGLTPARFATAEHPDASRAVVLDLLAEARDHLADGLAYCTALPATAYGVRRFCLSALYLARRTLRHIERTAGFPHRVRQVKISRTAVRRTVLAGTLIAPVNPLVRAYFHAL